MGGHVVLLLVVVVLLLVAAFIVYLLRDSRASRARRQEEARRLNDREQEEAERLIGSVQSVLDSWTKGLHTDGTATFTLEDTDPAEFGVRLVHGEKLYAASNAKRYAYKRDGRFVVAAARVSVPITKGVRFQAYGGRAHAPKSWMEEDVGRLFITNRAIIFDGKTRNIRATLGQIFKFDWGPNGITIEPSRGAIQRYEFDVSPTFAAALLVVMSADPDGESEPETQDEQEDAMPKPFDNAVGTDARGVKVYEID